MMPVSGSRLHGFFSWASVTRALLGLLSLLLLSETSARASDSMLKSKGFVDKDGIPRYRSRGGNAQPAWEGASMGSESLHAKQSSLMSEWPFTQQPRARMHAMFTLPEGQGQLQQAEGGRRRQQLAPTFHPRSHTARPRHHTCTRILPCLHAPPFAGRSRMVPRDYLGAGWPRPRTRTSFQTEQTWVLSRWTGSATCM